MADELTFWPFFELEVAVVAVFWLLVAVALLAFEAVADALSDGMGALVSIGETDAPAVGVRTPTNPVSRAHANPARSTAAEKTATIQYFVFMYSPSVTCPRG